MLVETTQTSSNQRFKKQKGNKKESENTILPFPTNMDATKNSLSSRATHQGINSHRIWNQSANKNNLLPSLDG